MLNNTCLITINNTSELYNRLQKGVCYRGVYSVELGVAEDSVLFNYQNHDFYDYFYAGFEIAYHLYLHEGTEYKAEFKDNIPLDFEFVLYANDRSDVDALFAILPPALLSKIKIVEFNTFVSLCVKIECTQVSPLEFLDCGVVYGKLMIQKYAYFTNKINE